MEPRNEREAHRAIANTCPPCMGDCMQGRECPAEPPHDPNALRWLLAILVAFWVGVAWLVGCMA